LLGSSGGLAKAILALLNKAITTHDDPLQAILKNAKLHLIDIKQQNPQYYSSLYPNLFSQIHLHQLDLKDLQAFKQHLMDTDTRLVIDVSWADTLEMLSCCDELGIPYVNTALENTSVDEDPTLYGFPLCLNSTTDDRINHTKKEIPLARRNDCTNRSLRRISLV
jgi:homospermidine synthase